MFVRMSIHVLKRQMYVHTKYTDLFLQNFALYM